MPEPRIALVIGAVTRAHRDLHALRALEAVHCDRWYDLWTGCVDEHWAGPHAVHAEAHAATMLAAMARHVFGFTWTRPGR